MYMKNNGARLMYAIREINDKLYYFGNIHSDELNLIKTMGVIDITDLKGKYRMKNGCICIAAGTTFKISSILGEHIWTSSNEDIIRKNEDGSFTATANKEVYGQFCDLTKTLYFYDESMDYCDYAGLTIYVDELITELSIDEQVNLSVEGTKKLDVNANADSIMFSNYIWKSSDSSIATVDDNGIVTAKKEGVAEITVMQGDGTGLSAKSTVLVTSDDTKINKEKSGEDIYIIYDKDTISDDVNLEVEKIEENHNDYESIKPEENVEFVAYDINLRDNKNNKVQPKGSVKVRIPCPRDYIGKNCKVYYVSPQGKYVEMKSEYSGGFIVFETTHFSTYMLTADKLAAGETEEQVKYGDVNGDGDIDTKDAVLIKKHLAGYTGLAIDLNAGDVNGDGDITSADAVLLLKYLAGYNIVLGR